MNQNLLQTIKLQQTASDPQNSAWVFASAGSGKTKILTDRVLRLLLDDVAPHKVLCLTFTKVAAAEMQNRINSELAEWILCDDAKLQKKLNELSGNFPTEIELKKARVLFIKILDEESKIKVQTIHSFCQNLIKIFPFESKVKPNFEVLESNQEKLLLKQAQKEVLKKAAHNEALKNLIQKINAKLHEENFAELVSELLSKKERLSFLKEKYFGIENVISEIFQNLAVSKNQNEDEIFGGFLSQINRDRNFNLASNLEIGSSSKNAETATKIRIFLDDPTPENFETYKLAFFTKETEPRKIYGEAAKDQANLSFMTECQKIILDFSDKINSLKIANDTALLLTFVDHILEIYSQLKNKNAFLDYNDLIIETNRLLANPDFAEWVKHKMDGTFDHILIDESQDTNHQQWNIIKALSEDFFSGFSASTKKRSIFIVGDEKQSIYSFQGAEPNISAEIFSYFEKKFGDQLKKIELNNSFRSTQKILQAVDKVFSTPERKSAISKISEFQTHQPIREGVGVVEVWPQVRIEKEKEEKSYEWQLNFTLEEEAQEKEILAKIIAAKIHDWVATGRLLENRARPVKYGDFMILLRNRTNGFSENLIKFFHQFGIPFSSISKIRFSESLLIQDLLAAAKFALLPYDDLNLACLLKSPIFGISEEELLEICLRKNEILKQVQDDREEAPPSIYSSLQDTNLKSTLDELIQKSQQLNCYEFFYFLLEEKNSRQNFLSRFGHESLEILDKFTLAAFDFCQNFSPNLQKFLEFIEKLDPEISLSEDEDNRVKITTIHSAKGLQAPIVMLPDCSYNFNQLLSAKEEISWLDEFPLWCSKKSGENSVLKEHRQKKLAEAKEEYLRLLYVAMTRPEDELYVGAFGKAKDPECWYEVVRNVLVECVKEFDVAEISIPQPSSLAQSAEDLISPTISLKRSSDASASKDDGGKSQINPAQIRGRLIHKILEIFGKNYSENKKWLEQLAEKISAQEKFLSDAEKNMICAQAREFLYSPQFEKLFCGKVKCEVEIAGEKNLKRIDLLVETENEILIVDYKSDESLPGTVPQQYLNQLRTYERLLKNLYPTRQIKTAILWTRFLKLQNF